MCGLRVSKRLLSVSDELCAKTCSKAAGKASNNACIRAGCGQRHVALVPQLLWVPVERYPDRRALSVRPAAPQPLQAVPPQGTQRKLRVAPATLCRERSITRQPYLGTPPDTDLRPHQCWRYRRQAAIQGHAVGQRPARSAAPQRQSVARPSRRAARRSKGRLLRPRSRSGSGRQRCPPPARTSGRRPRRPPAPARGTASAMSGTPARGR